MKKVAKLVTLVVFTILVCATAFAQPGDPSGDPDASIPLDEGLVVVLISGAAIGISKLVKKSK